MTKHQKRVVALLCEGHNNESIAHQLGIGITTVKRHLNAAMQLKQCNSRLELAVIVLRAQFAEQIARVRAEYSVFDMQSN